MDIILGRETIKEHDLVTHFPSHFFKRLTIANLGGPAVREVDVPQSASCIGNQYSRPVTAMHLRNLSDITHLVPEYSDSEWHSPAFEAFDSLIEETPVQDDINR